jgi:hypothetical protein
MDEEQAPKLYALDLEYVEELLEETEYQVFSGESLLRDLLNGELSSATEPVKLALVETLVTNLNIRALLAQEADPEYAVIKKDDTFEAENLILTHDTMSLLQSLLVARYYSNINLNNNSYSLSLH